MRRLVFLLCNLFLSGFLFGQKHILKSEILNNAAQYINPSTAFSSLVSERKVEGNFIENTTELERLCIYSNYYFNDWEIRKNVSDKVLSADARKILVDQVSLTEEEYLCFEKVIFGYANRIQYDTLPLYIDCKINQFLFKNLDAIFVNSDKAPIKNLQGVKTEIEIPGMGQYLIEYSDQGLFSKLTGPLNEPRFEIKYFDDCGLPDRLEVYRGADNLSRVEFERTSYRDWKGTKKYYSNGNLYFDHRDGGEYSFLKSYTFSMSGDTLSLREYDYTGQIADFYQKSYTKNLEGKITFRNGIGISNRLDRKKDSIYISSTKEFNESSIFYEIKDELGLNGDEILQVDSVFSHHFIDNLESSKESCVANYREGINSIFTDREIDFLPFINVSCEMLSEQIKERPRPHNFSFSKKDLIDEYKRVDGSIRNESALEFINEYFSFQTHVSKGWWVYYSGLVKFLKNKVDEESLLSSYNYSLKRLVVVAKSTNFNK